MTHAATLEARSFDERIGSAQHSVELLQPRYALRCTCLLMHGRWRADIATGLDDAYSPEAMASWKERVQAAVARGVVVRRVRIVPEPLMSEQLRWSWYTAGDLAAKGEQIRHLPVECLSAWLPTDCLDHHARVGSPVIDPEPPVDPQMLGGPDLLIIDHTVVYRVTWTACGEHRATTVLDSPDVVAEARLAFESAWTRARDLVAYRPTRVVFPPDDGPPGYQRRPCDLPFLEAEQYTGTVAPNLETT